jgi:hypothetical protein
VRLALEAEQIGKDHHVHRTSEFLTQIKLLRHEGWSELEREDMRKRVFRDVVEHFGTIFYAMQEPNLGFENKENNTCQVYIYEKDSKTNSIHRRKMLKTLIQYTTSPKTVNFRRDVLLRSSAYDLTKTFKPPSRMGSHAVIRLTAFLSRCNSKENQIQAAEAEPNLAL